MKAVKIVQFVCITYDTYILYFTMTIVNRQKQEHGNNVGLHQTANGPLTEFEQWVSYSEKPM